MTPRLSTDLGDPRLLRLLKAEAQERETSVKDVLKRALEAYFADRLETKALAKLAEACWGGEGSAPSPLRGRSLAPRHPFAPPSPPARKSIRALAAA